MFLEKLKSAAARNRSWLCVGLDFDPERAPAAFRRNPLAFNRRVIEATADLVCAYKPNTAFYEALGPRGLAALRATIAAVPRWIPVILDAKRGDIGNTSRLYAKAAFDHFRADAVTVAPYMGEDSVLPFLGYPRKGVFVLCLTSNPGAADFQRLKCAGRDVYLHVAEKCEIWKKHNPNLGLVVGATQRELERLRRVTALPFLVPGVGAQGGDLRRAVRAGNAGGLAVINASRSVIYPEGGGKPGDRIRAAARGLRDGINAILAE